MADQLTEEQMAPPWMALADEGDDCVLVCNLRGQPVRVHLELFKTEWLQLNECVSLPRALHVGGMCGRGGGGHMAAP